MSRAETKEEIHLKAAAGANPPALSHPAPAIAAEPAGFFLSLLGECPLPRVWRLKADWQQS